MQEGASTWVVIKGELWKVSVENLRPATSEENKGLEMVEQMLPSLKEEIQHRRRRREFWDVTGEGSVGPIPLSAHPATKWF